MIAQAEPSVSLWEKLIQIPSLNSLVQYLDQSGPVPAVLVLALGLVALVLGWKCFKLVVLANATIIGALLGLKLGSMLQGENMGLLGMLLGGLLFAALAMPLMKYAVSVMGALVGWCLGTGIWQYTVVLLGREDLSHYYWTGGLIGTITLGLLAFVIFKIVVIVFTSFQGSTMVIGSLLALLLGFEPARATVQGFLNNVHVPPLLVTVPAVIGFAYQYNAAKGGGKKKGEG